MIPKPLRNRVIVRIVNVERVTEKGGLIMPMAAMGSTVTGEVLALGERCELELKVGDIVQFNQASGQPIATKHEPLDIVCEDAILAVEEANSVTLVSENDAQRAQSKVIVSPHNLN